MARGGMNLVGPCMVEQVSSAGSRGTGMDGGHLLMCGFFGLNSGLLGWPGWGARGAPWLHPDFQNPLPGRGRNHQ